jgi:putative DNA primase/helicase
LLQRFQLLVWPDLSGEFSLIDRPANKQALTRMHQAITSLQQLSSSWITGVVKNGSGVQLLHFDKDAQELFNNWYQENETMLRAGSLSPSEHSHFAKYRSLVPGLALLFHLLNGHQDLVSKDSLQIALQFARYLKSHAKRTYCSVNGLDSAPTKALAKKLLEGKLVDDFTQRTLLHKGWTNLSHKDTVSLAVNALVERDWLSEHQSEKAGRKTTIYKINPRISEEYL